MDLLLLHLLHLITFLYISIILSTIHCHPTTSSPQLPLPNYRERLLLWPMPANVSFGHSSLPLATDFLFTGKIAGRVNQVPETLGEAFGRYTDLIFKTHLVDNPNSNQDQNSTTSLRSLVVDLDSMVETLKFGTDESYMLQVPDPNNSNSVYLKAKTVYGALRGLETFSQLCIFNFTIQTFEVQNTPLTISDKPRFAYRGLLIDTARHFQPVRLLKEIIDSMSYAKLNVFHWHIADDESFPLEIPSYERLWNGSYTESERYSIADAKDIVEYAQKRGIHVMAELDVPGHAKSWGIGYPTLWPSAQCRQPLDVSKEFTFQVIDGVISDLAKVFTFDFIHLGGDEVNTGCWTDTPQVNEWMRNSNLTERDAYKMFVLKAGSLARSRGYSPVNWEETFNNFHNEMDKTTVIHNWFVEAVPSIVKAGFRCILSNQDAWYLDHLDTTWEQFYENEPTRGISKQEEQQRVLGGEVCMWGERVDASNIQQTIWPRTAGAAERMWGDLTQIAAEPSDVLGRLENFRCLLIRRGVAAAPLLVKGRESPEGPGSCFMQ